MVLDMKEDHNIPLILGQPFLATCKMTIDIQEGLLTLKEGKEKVTFNIFKHISYLKEEPCNQVEMLDKEFVDKRKANSGSRRQSSFLSCFNTKSNHVIKSG